MEKILKSLTIEQAMEWDRATDKWVFIDDTILAPANLKATDKRVEAIEDEFMAIIEYEARLEDLREDLANRKIGYF